MKGVGMICAPFLKTIVAALCFACASGASAKIVLEGPWFELPAPAQDGWLSWTPSAEDVKGKTVELLIPVTNVSYRAFNRFYAEFENENEPFACDIEFATRRPRFNGVKGKHTLPSGKSSAGIFMPGIGAPAVVRWIKLSVPKETAQTLAKPIKMRFRLQLTDYNYRKHFHEAVTHSVAHELPMGFTDSECAAGDAVRAQIREKVRIQRKIADSDDATVEDRIRAHERLMAIRDNAPWLIERASLVSASRNERGRGMFLYGCSSGTDKIPREDAFVGNLRGKVNIETARGEAEGAQITLFSDSPVEDVSWRVTVPTNANGKVAKGIALSMSPVGYVTTSDPAYIPPRQFRATAPDPILEHVRKMDLAAREFQPFYIDVSASDEAQPGVYHARAEFCAAEGTLRAEVPIAVTVHAFRLPRPRSFPMIFSSPTFSPKNPLLKAYEKDEKIISDFCAFLQGEKGEISGASPGVRRLWGIVRGMQKLLADHHIPTQDIYGHLKHIEPNWLRNLQLADSPNWYCLGYCSAPATERVAAQLEPMRKAKTSKAAYLYGFDEIRLSDKRAFERMKRDFGAVKATFPEVRTMCTALDGTFGEQSNTEEEVDIWVYPSASYVGASSSAERARARGKQVWYYPCNYPFHPNANLHLENLGTSTRVLTGLYPWKYKADGMLYYATAMFTIEKGEDERIVAPKILRDDPICGMDYCYSVFRSNGDGTLFYAGPDGVVPSLRLKQIRDGVDDYEYLKLLEKTVARVEKDVLRVADKESFVREAKSLMDIPDDLCCGDTRYPSDAGLILAWRSRVTKLLDEAASAEKIKMVAHRGAGDLSMPEASRPAYSNAVECAMDIVKFDLRKTKDGVIVMSHDPSLERMMGWDVNIADVAYSEIFEKGRYLSEDRKPTSHRIVRLDEAIAIAKDIPEFWIDFKYFDPEFAERVLKEFEKFGISQDRMMVATFNSKALEYFKRTHPSIRRIAHISNDKKGEKLYAYCNELGLWGVNMPAWSNSTSAKDIAELKKRGLWVSLWFVQNDKTAERYRDSGANAFVTDYVSKIR